MNVVSRTRASHRQIGLSAAGRPMPRIFRAFVGRPRWQQCLLLLYLLIIPAQIAVNASRQVGAGRETTNSTRVRTEVLGGRSAVRRWALLQLHADPGDALRAAGGD